MKRSYFAVAALGAVVAIAAAAPAFANTDLIISEYVEGSSNNKVIEIWNHTGGAIDLTAGAYKIQMYFNGAVTAGTTIALTGVIADNATFVIAHSSAAAGVLAIANQTNGSLNFNGDDAVVLVKGAGNTTVDAFGQIGFDPGTEWGAGLQSTADNTLRRKASVCDGDLDGANVFDPTIEWDGFAVDTFSGLGAHADNCGPVPAIRSSWGTVKTLYR
jgi:predicted extracellular nuclease